MAIHLLKSKGIQVTSSSDLHVRGLSSKLSKLSRNKKRSKAQKKANAVGVVYISVGVACREGSHDYSCSMIAGRLLKTIWISGKSFVARRMSDEQMLIWT